MATTIHEDNGMYLKSGSEKSHQPNIGWLDALDFKMLKNLAHTYDQIVANFVTNHCKDMKALNDLSPSGDFPRKSNLIVVDNLKKVMNQ